MQVSRHKLSWPHLNDRYAEALHSAVDYILSKFEPIGIILGGSVLSDKFGNNSDFDIVIVHEEPYYRRIFKIFNKIPTDLLINTPASIKSHLDFDNLEVEPKMAHMLATGFVILAKAPIIEHLIHTARLYLEQSPIASEQEIIRLKYLSVNYLADAEDSIEKDPSIADLLITLSVEKMIKYFYRNNSLFVPQAKDLINDIRKKDHKLGEDIDSFFRTCDQKMKIMLAKRIATQTIEVSKFFEWANEKTESKVV